MTVFKQQGLTLVELMLAMTVGLLLMGFVVQAFVANKATNRFNEGLSDIQERGRYGIDLLRSDIRMSARRLDPTTLPVVGPLAGVDGGGNDSDLLTIRYQGRVAAGGIAADVNCIGVAVVGPAPGIIFNTFDLQPGANGRSALFCNGTEILPNVDNLQFEYGVDLTNDGAANAYLPAGAVNMNRVVSVRMAMLLSTENNVGSNTAAQDYVLLGQNVGPFADQRLRRVFSLTVVIRNDNNNNNS